MLRYMSATRNRILSIDFVPLKSPVPNFTALCTVQSLLPLLHSLPSSHSAAHLLCSLVFLRLLMNSSLHLINTFTSPYHTPIFQPWGTISRVEELEILITLYVIFITVSQPIPVGLQPLTCSDCEFESR